MKVTVIRDQAALAALWPEWAVLWDQARDASPFVSPAWLEPWWACFGTAYPVVATLRDENRLLGILPLYRLDNKLLPIGVGISDYFDALLAPDAPAGAAAELLRGALDASEADRCDLPELPPEAVMRDVAAPDGWRAEDWCGPPCPVLTLAPQPNIPKGMRRDIRQAGHRARRAGGCEMVRADVGSLPGLLEALVHLHQGRWRGRGEAGVLADPDVLRFHRLATRRLLADGLLRMEAVRYNDRIAAVIYALLSDRRIYFYLSGFSPDFAFESPGTMLLGHMIKQAAAEGRHEAHFLRGDERYKYAWGGVNRFNIGRGFIRS